MAKDKKKGHPFLVTLLVIFGLLLGTAVAAFCLLYDNTRIEGVNLDADMEEVAKSVYVESTDDTKDTGKIKYGIKYDDFNGVMNAKLNELVGSVEGLKDTIDYVCVNLDNDLYVVTMKLSPVDKFVESNVSVAFSFSKNTTEDDEVYALALDHIKLGHITVSKDFINWVLGLANVSLEQYLADLVKQTGFSFKYSDADKAIVVSRNDLVKDIKKQLSLDEDKFYLAVLDFAMENKLIEIGRDSTYLLKAEVDFNDVENIYRNSDKLLNYDIAGLIAKIRTLLSGNKIALDKSAYVYDFLLNGYDDISESDREYIDTLDLTSIDIADATAYTGIKVKSGQDFKQNIVESINLVDFMTSGSLFKVDEAALDNLLRDQDTIGYLFEMKNETKYNVITIDDMYSDIYDGNVYINVMVDINGFKLDLTLKTVVSLSNQYDFILTVDTIYFGDKACSETLVDQVFLILNNNLGSSNFSVDSYAKTLTIKLADIFTSEILNAMVSYGGQPNAKIVGTAIADAGYIDFSLAA